MRALIAGMPTRIAAVVGARGGNTRYWTQLSLFVDVFSCLDKMDKLKSLWKSIGKYEIIRFYLNF